MVLDTRTLDSLYDLAAVVRDFTTPSRGGRELKPEEEDQRAVCVQNTAGTPGISPKLWV